MLNSSCPGILYILPDAVVLGALMRILEVKEFFKFPLSREHGY